MAHASHTIHISEFWARVSDIITRILEAWDPQAHPRDKATGRFISRNSPAAASAAKSAVRAAIRKPKNANVLGELLEHLNILTVKQIHELRADMGLKSSGLGGANRDALVRKIADRLGATAALRDYADSGEVDSGDVDGEVDAPTAKRSGMEPDDDGNYHLQSGKDGTRAEDIAGLKQGDVISVDGTQGAIESIRKQTRKGSRSANPDDPRSLDSIDTEQTVVTVRVKNSFGQTSKHTFYGDEKDAGASDEQPAAAPSASEQPAAQPAETGAGKAKEIRFEVGKKLSPEDRDKVLKSVTDAYKETGHQKEMVGLTANDEEIWRYPYDPSRFVTSDITGAKVRHYIILPDGRKAHPSELFPNITQSDVLKAVGEAQYAEKESKRINKERVDRGGDSKSEANINYGQTGRPLPHSYFAESPDGKIVRVDGTDKDDVEFFDNAGYRQLTAPVPADASDEKTKKIIQANIDRVPASVLADYPDLAAKHGKSESKQDGGKPKEPLSRDHIVSSLKNLEKRAEPADADYESIERELNQLTDPLTKEEAIAAAKEFGIVRPVSSRKAAIDEIKRKVFMMRHAREVIQY